MSGWRPKQNLLLYANHTSGNCASVFCGCAGATLVGWCRTWNGQISESAQAGVLNGHVSFIHVLF